MLSVTGGGGLGETMGWAERLQGVDAETRKQSPTNKYQRRMTSSRRRRSPWSCRVVHEDRREMAIFRDGLIVSSLKGRRGYPREHPCRLSRWWKTTSGSWLLPNPTKCLTSRRCLCRPHTQKSPTGATLFAVGKTKTLRSPIHTRNPTFPCSAARFSPRRAYQQQQLRSRGPESGQTSATPDSTRPHLDVPDPHSLVLPSMSAWQVVSVSRLGTTIAAKTHTGRRTSPPTT